MSTAATQTVEITIGWTRSEVVDGRLVYSSYGDGYKPGASQHTETFEVEVEPGTTAEQIADAAFLATNAPFIAEGSLASRILTQIQHAGYRGQGAHYSLSVGDTVTVSEVMLACAGFGWERVTLAPAEVS